MINNRSERRRHKRLMVHCPVIVRNDAGVVLADTQTIDLSAGGALVPVPLGVLPRSGRQVSVEIYVANSPNGGSCRTRAKIIRHAILKDESRAGLALQFEDAVQGLAKGA